MLGTDDMTAGEALDRLRWDPVVAPLKASARVAVALLSRSPTERPTCRSQYRTAHNCKYGPEACKYAHAIHRLVEPDDIREHCAAVGDVDAFTIVREAKLEAFERLAAPAPAAAGGGAVLEESRVVYLSVAPGVKLWQAHGAPDAAVWDDAVAAALAARQARHHASTAAGAAAGCGPGAGASSSALGEGTAASNASAAAELAAAAVLRSARAAAPIGASLAQLPASAMLALLRLCDAPSIAALCRVSKGVNACMAQEDSIWRALLEDSQSPVVAAAQTGRLWAWQTLQTQQRPLGSASIADSATTTPSPAAAAAAAAASSHCSSAGEPTSAPLPARATGRAAGLSSSRGSGMAPPLAPPTLTASFASHAVVSGLRRARLPASLIMPPEDSSTAGPSSTSSTASVASSCISAAVSYRDACRVVSGDAAARSPPRSPSMRAVVGADAPALVAPAAAPTAPLLSTAAALRALFLSSERAATWGQALRASVELQALRASGVLDAGTQLVTDMTDALADGSVGDGDSTVAASTDDEADAADAGSASASRAASNARRLPSSDSHPRRSSGFLRHAIDTEPSVTRTLQAAAAAAHAAATASPLRASPAPVKGGGGGGHTSSSKRSRANSNASDDSEGHAVARGIATAAALRRSPQLRALPGPALPSSRLSPAMRGLPGPGGSISSPAASRADLALASVRPAGSSPPLVPLAPASRGVGGSQLDAVPPMEKLSLDPALADSDSDAGSHGGDDSDYKATDADPAMAERARAALGLPPRSTASMTTASTAAVGTMAPGTGTPAHTADTPSGTASTHQPSVPASPATLATVATAHASHGLESGFGSIASRQRSDSHTSSAASAATMQAGTGASAAAAATAATSSVVRPFAGMTLSQLQKMASTEVGRARLALRLLRPTPSDFVTAAAGLQAAGSPTTGTEPGSGSGAEALSGGLSDAAGLERAWTVESERGLVSALRGCVTRTQPLPFTVLAAGQELADAVVSRVVACSVPPDDSDDDDDDDDDARHDAADEDADAPSPASVAARDPAPGGMPSGSAAPAATATSLSFQLEQSVPAWSALQVCVQAGRIVQADAVPFDGAAPLPSPAAATAAAGAASGFASDGAAGSSGASPADAGYASTRNNKSKHATTPAKPARKHSGAAATSASAAPIAPAGPDAPPPVLLRGLGIASGCGIVRGGVILGAAFNGVTSQVKAVATDASRIAVVDRGGTIRVHAADGTRLASGKASGSGLSSSTSGASLSASEAAGITGIASADTRCCTNVCSMDMADDLVATGHADGSVVVSVMGGAGSQTMRAGAVIRIEDSIAPTSSALSASFAGSTGSKGGKGRDVSAHTSVAFLQETTDLLVARRVRRGGAGGASTGAAGATAGLLSLHAADGGALIRSWDAVADVRDASTTSLGLPRQPTVLHAAGPHTALVGYSDGLLRLIDSRVMAPVLHMRLDRDPARSLRRWAAVTSGAVAAATLPVAGGAAGASDAVDGLLEADAVNSSWIPTDAAHVPGYTARHLGPHALLHGVPVDADCAIQHVFVRPGRWELIESRVSPIVAAVAAADAAFAPRSSPFVRCWDMRMSTGGTGSSSSGTTSGCNQPFHVIDLGPRALRAVAGVAYDNERVVIAHQHLHQPRDRAERLAAVADDGHPGAGAAPMQFHWNRRDRLRAAGAETDGAAAGGDAGTAGEDAASPVDAHQPRRLRLWHDIAESDLPLHLVPRYMWPIGHAPPLAVLHRHVTFGSAAPSAVTSGTGCAPHADAEADELATFVSPHARAPRAPRFAEMSSLSVWDPHLLTATAVVPLPSVTALASRGPITAVGTDSGALHWHTARGR